MKTCQKVALKITSLLFLFSLLNSCTLFDNSQEEQGTNIVVPATKGVISKWRSVRNDNHLTKVTVVLNTIENKLLSVDSVISIDNNPFTEKTSYSVHYTRQDSFFSKKTRNSLLNYTVSSYKESYLKQNKQWVLDRKRTTQFDVATNTTITTDNHYQNNKLIDSSVYFKSPTHSIHRKLSMNELNTLALEKIDSTVFTKDSIILSNIKHWDIYEKRQGMDFHGVWTDSTLRKREYYSEQITQNNRLAIIIVEFIPNVTPNQWLLYNIESLYKPLLKKINTEYVLDGNKIDYSCLLSQKKEICYESYRNGGTSTLKVGTFQEGENCACAGEKTLARIHISIRDKNNE
jgi:hypothetical protein